MNLLLIGNLQSNYRTNPTVCDELAQTFSKQGWRVIAVSRHSNKVIKLADMLFTCLLQRHNFDLALIDVYSSLAFFWAEAVSTVLRRLRKRYVLTLHGGNLPDLANRQPERVIRLLKYADAVTTPSEYLKSQMGIFRNDIRIIPNALEISRYEFVQRKTARPALLWLRAFHRIYNPCLALQVVYALKENFPDIHLTMVGPDKHDGSLDEFRYKIQQLDLIKHVSIVGGVSKDTVPSILQRGDIFINTTNVDNAPVSVLESMATGLCVVSTNAGGIPYLLKNGKDALVVPLGDADAMSNAITRILREPELAAHLSWNARQRAEQFDLSVVLIQWKTLFNELVKYD